jgi:hypothetical protein
LDILENPAAYSDADLPPVPVNLQAGEKAGAANKRGAIFFPYHSPSFFFGTHVNQLRVFLNFDFIRQDRVNRVYYNYN